MNELALFAGNGGGILAAKLLGWRTVCAVELDTYRAERLAQRQNEGFLPPFPIWNGDITDFDGRPWRGLAQIVSGGFPCQDVSAANPNATGITGERSGLWKEMFRVIREVGPEYVLVENSPMLTSRGLGTVLGDLAAVGYDAQWGVLGADDLGGFHRRERLFIVGYTDRARLEGLTGNGNGDRGEDARRYTPEAGLRVLANSVGQRSFPSTQPGIHREEEGRRTRDVESERRDRAVADCDRLGRRLEQQQPVGEGEGAWNQSSGGHSELAGGASPSLRGADCLWLDREFIACRDGKIRATKPGLCGMANGVANRMVRISAIGDGQVPPVVAAIWNILSDLCFTYPQ